MSTIDQRAQEFIDQELKAIVPYLENALRRSLIRRGIGVDDELVNSLAAQAANDELQLRFLTYGRFVDMGAGRGYNKGRYMGREERSDLLKGRTKNPFYSRTSYGVIYGTLLNNLMNKYVQEAPAALVQDYNNA